MDLRELDLQPLAQLQVERAERLVEQEDVGAPDERPGDGDPLLLSAGELVGEPLAEVLETDEPQRLAGALRAVASCRRAPS